VKGVASSAEIYPSKKLAAWKRRVEMDGFMVTYVGGMHGRELEEEWTGQRQ
jgi:hypothetical protein